jgi:hypothetical protein
MYTKGDFRRESPSPPLTQAAHAAVIAALLSVVAEATPP